MVRRAMHVIVQSCILYVDQYVRAFVRFYRNTIFVIVYTHIKVLYTRKSVYVRIKYNK